MEIKKSALEDSSNEMSDDEYKKGRADKTDSNHVKVNKSSSTPVKKNPLQNTAKLGKFIKLISYHTSIILFCNIQKKLNVLINNPTYKNCHYNYHDI